MSSTIANHATETDGQPAQLMLNTKLCCNKDPSASLCCQAVEKGESAYTLPPEMDLDVQT